jgi:rod shape determining protein RodA
MRPYFTVFDGPLTAIILMLLTVSMITLYSASIGIPGKMEDQVRNILLSFFVMWVVANISPQMMMRIAVPAYAFGVFLLVCVALFGTIKLGARRWLHIGVVDIQPSEFMKIVTPLMLAWFFQSRAGHLTWQSYAIAAVLLVVPVGLIVRQPDLGTALLVVAAGFCVIFLAGLAWKALVGLFVAGAARCR